MSSSCYSPGLMFRGSRSRWALAPASRPRGFEPFRHYEAGGGENPPISRLAAPSHPGRSLALPDGKPENHGQGTFPRATGQAPNNDREVAVPTRADQAESSLNPT